MNMSYYRITGPQSVERIEPLLIKKLKDYCNIKNINPVNNNSNHNRNSKFSTMFSIQLSNKTVSNLSDEVTDNNNTDNDEVNTVLIYQNDQLIDTFNLSAMQIDFVWETFCEYKYKLFHINANILNRLHNSVIIENKSNLAFIQLLTRKYYQHIPTLESYIAKGSIRLSSWAYNRWNSNDITDSDWWAVKCSQGNGGRDVYIMNSSNYKQVLNEIGDNNVDEYVIQRYILKPSLWQGKKFHYRCYSIVKADMTSYLYSIAYILTAGINYYDDTNNSDTNININKHLTNLSLNKKCLGHPGQVPINIKLSNPMIFGKISTCWSNIIEIASKFMKYQINASHFEFFGIDIIVDEFNQCWLIEANRLPGLESSNNNKVIEDEMYDTMMSSLLDIILEPIHEIKSSNDNNLWIKIKESCDDMIINSNSNVWKNLFLWKAHTLSYRNEIVI